MPKPLHDSSVDNLFDQLGFGNEEAVKAMEQARVDGQHLDYLIHRTFAQSEHGRELLALWKESLIMTPSVVPGMDPTDWSKREGIKDFIRNIIITINKVEKGHD